MSLLLSVILPSGGMEKEYVVVKRYNSQTKMFSYGGGKDEDEEDADEIDNSSNNYCFDHDYNLLWRFDVFLSDCCLFKSSCNSTGVTSFSAIDHFS